MLSYVKYFIVKETDNMPNSKKFKVCAYACMSICASSTG